MHGNKHLERYPPKVRKFCLTAHFYSPKLYSFIRDQFNNHLPHPDTIRKWYSNSNTPGDAGFEKNTYDRLRKIVNDMNGEPLIVSLIFDEMYIRKQIYWCNRTHKYMGHITYGSNPNESELPIAKQIIVFFLSGLNKFFEFPVGYHLIGTLSSEQKAELVLDVIKIVTECGVRIANLTFDGLRSNGSMCELLGTNLDIFSKDFKTYFENPVDRTKIYIIMDAVHMLKLIRNNLASKQIIYDGNNNKIEWKFIEALQKTAESTNIPTHKLQKKHVQWKANIMNVRIAAETLSDSVADSIEYQMKKGNPEFAGAEPTIQFIRKVNRTFDIFNSQSINENNIFKRAINVNNKRVIFSFFQECSGYFQSLKIESIKKSTKNDERSIRKRLIPIVSAPSKIGFKGFIINMESLKRMYAEYIEDSNMKFIPTYALSQDHLEIFFGKIRSANGLNNNPNALQFKSAYRKLQCNLNISVPEHSNCRIFNSKFIDNLQYANVYFVSSLRNKLNLSNNANFLAKLDAQSEKVIEELSLIDDAKVGYSLTDSPVGSSIAYVARQIEDKIENVEQFYCDQCRHIFNENEKLNGCYLSSNYVRPPCVSTYNICTITDKHLMLFLSRNFDFNVLYYRVFQEINWDQTYEKSNFQMHRDHKYHLVKCIVNEYSRMKSNRIAKKLTMDEHVEILRSKLTKLIHYIGQ